MIELVTDSDDFIVINKPCGIGVHAENGEPGIVTLAEQQFGHQKLYLVHRLDKVTSGLLILAKHAAAAATLSQLFAKRQIEKTYLAITDHKPAKKQGQIRGDMQKSRNGTFKLARSLDNPAITQFFSQSLTPGLRLCILRPHTGKTHQLRVAMKSLGAPILGDKSYAGSDAERVFLHAYQLRFEYHHCLYQFRALPSDNMAALLRAGGIDKHFDPNSQPWPSITKGAKHA